MKQIYYTQCPIGYGLGASNGFQIKRLSPGYALAGDFRHLGLRAFLAGTRTMAPPALRYRRGVGGMAEVAWLTPRSHEYETERGLWGRPGGHFAHGLQLDDDEFEALSAWPAGLYDRPFWTRSDPEPSRGRAPESLELSPDDLRAPPTFEAVAPLAGDDVECLAQLLTALAASVRQGRTLFLIDAPERLGDRMALLTFAFPALYRAALTFSTYHDRPEELPGFRLQGTIPGARPNRLALLSLGIVADLTAGAIEPGVEPERWARTLAGWLVRRDGLGREAWEATDRRARAARVPEPPEAIWSADWLDRLFGFHALVRATLPAPVDPAGWSDLAGMTHWAVAAGLAGPWLQARGPSWWESSAAEGSEALEALLAHVGLPESWRVEGAASAWGAALARWVERALPADRQRALATALRAAPSTARPGFVRALIKALPPAIAEQTLSWLKLQPVCDRALVLPLEVRPAVETALVRRDLRPLRDVLARAFELPAGLTGVLDALAAEANDRPGTRGVLADLLAEALDAADPRMAADVRNWALRQADAAHDWLGRPLRRAFANPMNHDAWRALRAQTPPELQPALARVVLGVAQDRTLPDEPFRWGVEEVLLPLDESRRPHDPAWPRTYLERMPSGLDLLKRLFRKEYRQLGVRRWLDRSRMEGELTPEQVARLDGCEHYARVLRSGDARALLDIKLPAIPPEERGMMLAQVLGHLGGDSDDTLHLILDTCREAWPGAFDAGAVGLEGLALALAEPLMPLRSAPNRWFDRLVRILDRLKLTRSAGRGFEPDSLAAEVVAATTRRPGPAFDPWRLRQFLFQHDDAWRILAVDVVRDLQGKTPDEGLELLAHWDHRLDKGLRAARFFELWLNVCDGPALAATVSARAADLRSFGPLFWWTWDRVPDACNDLRDAFARRAPMAPLDASTVVEVGRWLSPSRRVGRSARPTDPTTSDLVPLEPPMLPGADATERDWSYLSERGRVRWHCLEALSDFNRTGIEALGRWSNLLTKRYALRLEVLDLDDRYRFLAWLIQLTDALDDPPVPPLADWLFKVGVTDPDRIKAHWADELAGLVEVVPEIHPARMKFVRDLWEELKKVVLEQRERRRKSPVSDSP